MNDTHTKIAPTLTETIAVRLTLDESRALVALARRDDRTISYLVRNQLRSFLRGQNAA